MKISSGFPANYKERRRGEWGRLSSYWPSYVRDDSFHRKSHERLREHVLDRAQAAEERSLVDLGCGAGDFIRGVRNCANWSSMLGIDFCDRMLELARCAEIGGNPPVTYRLADVEGPISHQAPEATCSIGTAAFLLDEVEDVRACFATAASFIKRGGSLVCATLDPARELHRLGRRGVRIGDDGGPIVVARNLRGHPDAGEYFRVLRASHVLDAHAAEFGFRAAVERLFSPSDLGSRSDGPGLRLLTWNRA